LAAAGERAVENERGGRIAIPERLEATGGREIAFTKHRACLRFAVIPTGAAFSAATNGCNRCP